MSEDTLTPEEEAAAEDENVQMQYLMALLQLTCIDCMAYSGLAVDPGNVTQDQGFCRRHPPQWCLKTVMGKPTAACGYPLVSPQNPACLDIIPVIREEEDGAQDTSTAGSPEVPE